MAGAVPGPGRNRVVVGGAAVLAVAAVVGVILAPKLFGGPSDPGCKAYANTALPAYNKTINDLNAQAPQATLDTDMAAAITDLSAAAAKAKASAATSALDTLLAKLKTVRADVARGSVPTSTVSALTADSTAADNAC